MHNGKVVIVTGAGNGIGKGIALEFAKAGALVVVSEIDEQSGNQTAEELRQIGGSALFIQTDVASEQSICGMVKRTVEALGRIDVLVNNAGITVFKPILEATSADWDRLMNIDLRGVFLCSKYAAEHMKRQGKGSIINISSNHSVATLPDAEMYAAAKAGVNGLTRSMALSLGKLGIRVNAICPGFTNTPHYRQWLENDGKAAEIEAEVISLHAGNRIGTPEDVGKLALFLASDDSAMMTGAELLLDGGLSTRLYHSKLC
ncbi:SDR family NAD(P)-dependent oxidoreductase [Paenibacillus sp. GXUN7292]|uniref:SDR family NAD(P)-dependent oxidoreductase n=1 Tax=Paenibacillus sp. GXUN7292 TaxID=3422499 RepID=UPI003D7DB7E5